MQKTLLSALALIVMASSLFAYNPPTGGEELYRLSEPELLVGGRSAAGGSLFYVTPASIVNNPALTALEQRTMLGVGYTALIDSDDDSGDSYGNAFQLGLTVPSKWGVVTGLVEGVMSPFYDMHLGHSFDFRAGFAKDVTDVLSVGTSADVGIFYGDGTDWTAGIDVGALWSCGQVGFLKDFRIGASLLNLGKPFTNAELLAMDGESEAEAFPGLATLKAGVAAILLEKGKTKLGFSSDLSFPTFQNVVFDAGMQLSYNDIIRLSTSWEANLREILEDNKINLPAVGLSFKFVLNSSKLAQGNADWGQSEMLVSSAWQQLYGNVQAVSGSALLKLGMSDTTPPEITLWNE